jgi:hypothetical protein
MSPLSKTCRLLVRGSVHLVNESPPASVKSRVMAPYARPPLLLAFAISLRVRGGISLPQFSRHVMLVVFHGACLPPPAAIFDGLASSHGNCSATYGPRR